MTLLQKNDTRLDSLEEELYRIKDNIQSLHEKCKSMNNTTLASPVPIVINDTTSPTHTILKHLLLHHRYFMSITIN